MIPDVAVNQYLASLANWFGLSDQRFPEIFLNVEIFSSDGSVASA
ncbi:MAG: hypothetical protein ACSHXK_13915 [Oceanococcus sp.]